MTAANRFNIQELEDIALQEVESISSKAKLMSFISVMKNVEAEPDQETAEKIASWIESTWPEATVRAKMAQKIAKLIREGEWASE